jgi:hypothetical protein
MWSWRIVSAAYTIKIDCLSNHRLFGHIDHGELLLAYRQSIGDDSQAHMSPKMIYVKKKQNAKENINDHIPTCP